MTYQLEEAVLDLPIHWRDRTLNIFAASPDHGGMSLSVARHDPKGGTLDTVYKDQLTELSRALPRFEVIDERSVKVGHQRALSARFTWSSKGQAMVQHLVFVAYYDKVMIFAGSAPLERRDEALAAFDQILESVRFRRRD